MNVAVFEYETGSGPGYLTALNLPLGLHSEEVIDQYIAKAGIDKSKVTRIYSERVSCSTAKHECGASSAWLTIRNASVGWSFSGNSSENL